ncbi:hypothetical protein LINPERPRIM_LOCUS22627 [Linum perenne]
MVKEGHVFIRRLTAINCFITRASERHTPFFKTLKTAAKFTWIEECTKAFEALRDFLVSPLVLVSPRANDELFLYIAVAPLAIITTLVRREENVEQPIFYVSKTLVCTKERYSSLDKFAYIVVCASRKLKPYF